MTPFRKVLKGTCYELEDHTVAVTISEKQYEQFKQIRFLLEGRNVKAVIIADYPDTVLEGWSEEDKRTVDDLLETESDVRVDYSELHLWHDGDILWRYGVKHVDGRVWEAAWVTQKELEDHFEPKERK